MAVIRYPLFVAEDSKDFVYDDEDGNGRAGAIMNYWIFRGNREDFDIDTYLRDFKYIYWAVKYPKHQREINFGDPVFIWRSKGKSNKPYGVVAFGHIAETATHKGNVKHPKFLLEEYWKKREVSPIKVGIQLDEARLDLESGLVDSQLLKSDSELSGMQILTAGQGTNFKISDRQFQKIYWLWTGEGIDLEEDDYSTEEGKAKLRLHKVRERDRKLVALAKQQYMKKHGRLFCEVCGFDFNEKYGFNYAEAHHKKPLSKIIAGEKTKVSDLAILCANCHRAVHLINSDDPWNDLLKIHNRLCNQIVK